MKRVAAALLLAVICCGCSREGDPYRVDTVVRIPVSPTDGTVPAASGTAAPTEDPAWNDGIWNGGWFETEPAATEKKQDTHPSRENALPEWTMPAVPPETEQEPTRYAVTDYVPDGLLDAINAYRRDAGMPALTLDETLCTIASVRSWELAQYWSHTRPDGRDYATVLTDYGYSGEAVAELSARISGEYDPAVAADMWIQSDAHRQMLLAQASHAGIGLFCTADAVCICLILVR